MPRGDRTGPNGMGPLTGRGAGYCSGNIYPGFLRWSRVLGLLCIFAIGRRYLNRKRNLPGRGLNRRR
jgi:hypothetical protein